MNVKCLSIRRANARIEYGHLCNSGAADIRSPDAGSQLRAADKGGRLIAAVPLDNAVTGKIRADDAEREVGAARYDLVRA